MADTGVAYIRVELHPEDRAPLEKLIDQRVSERLASLGGQLLEAHGAGGLHPNASLAALGGYLVEEQV